MQCYECQSARYLDPQNNLCLECVVGCLSCEDGDSCANCDADAHFVLDGDQKCVCESTYFLNGTNECESCIEGCVECANNTDCITCDSQKGFIEEGGKCVCAPGFFDDQGLCVACIRGCLQCEDEQSCTPGGCDAVNHYTDGDNNTCECNAEEHFEDDGDNCVCIAGYYLDTQQNTCEKCRLGCSECSAADVCTACQPGLHIEGDLCVCD